MLPFDASLVSPLYVNRCSCIRYMKVSIHISQFYLLLSKYHSYIFD
jgi:hypothetical protein